MKKILLSAALVSFLAFAANAQTPQTTEAAPAKKKCCANKAKACGPGEKSSAKACCKDKGSKACSHDSDKAEGTSTEVETVNSQKVKPSTTK